jgi:hypothetical protein
MYRFPISLKMLFSLGLVRVGDLAVCNQNHIVRFLSDEPRQLIQRDILMLRRGFCFTTGPPDSRVKDFIR